MKNVRLMKMSDICRIGKSFTPNCLNKLCQLQVSKNGFLKTRQKAAARFGLTGAKSKYVAQDKSGQVELDPEKLFFGISKKQNKINKLKSSGKK